MRFLIDIPSWTLDNSDTLTRATELSQVIAPMLAQDQELRVASYPDIPLGTCGRTSGLCRLLKGHAGVCVFVP